MAELNGHEMRPMMQFLLLALSIAIANAQSTDSSAGLAPKPEAQAAQSKVIAVGTVSAINAHSGMVLLSINGTPKWEIFPEKDTNILLYTLTVGDRLKVSGEEEDMGEVPAMQVASFDDISLLNPDGTTRPWPNPIAVEGDPNTGQTPMLAFTGAIRESDARQAHDSLMARYQAKLTQRTAAMAATSGGRTGLPLGLTYFMSKDAVLEHLKLMDSFRVDTEPDCLSYVLPNPETNSNTTLVMRFDGGKLVQITDGKYGLAKAAFDPYMENLKAIAAQWRESGMTTVFTDDKQMRYVYEDAQSFVCVFGVPDKRTDVYMAGIEFTEKTYHFNHIHN